MAKNWPTPQKYSKIPYMEMYGNEYYRVSHQVLQRVQKQ